jgi:beta-lactamase class A
MILALASTAPDPAPADPIVVAAQAAEKASGATVGVSVLHLESGRAVSHRGGERFQMASVFKVPVAIATLDAVEKGKVRLDREVEILEKDRMEIGPLYEEWKPGMRVTVARMVDVMLVDSDNTAADVLVAQLGGPPAVEKALVARGASGVKVSLDEKGLGAAMKRDLAASAAPRTARARTPWPASSSASSAASSSRRLPRTGSSTPCAAARRARSASAPGSRKARRSSTRPGRCGSRQTTWGS